MATFPIFIIANRGAGLGPAQHSALHAGERAADEVQDLQAQVDRLALACAALWSLVKEHGHTDDELLARMQELDLRDGKLDGRMAADVATCSACGRKTKVGRRTCLYCGKEMPAGPVFGKS